MMPMWSHWIRQLKAIAQNGNTYAKNPFDLERYHALETDGTGFFRENDLPPLSTSRVTEAQIRRIFEHHRNPSLPTDFD
jgi:hypothetical protein